MKWAFISLALFYVTSSHATTVNKCVDANGRITFTQSTCSTGVKAEPVKISPSSGHSDGYSSTDKNKKSDIANRKIYFYDIDFTGDVAQRMRKASSIIKVVLIKARDCESRLKALKEKENSNKDCSEFEGYFLDGSVYNQAVKHVDEFTDEEKNSVGAAYSRFLNNVEEIVSVKEFIVAYKKSL